jgi:hypothetical protein
MTTFYIQQFGCRATQADGAALERQLLDRGCTQTPTPHPPPSSSSTPARSPPPLMPKPATLSAKSTPKILTLA